MQRSELVTQIRNKRSYLCVGLDTDIEKIPSHLKEDPDALFTFNKAIIDATREHCVAYKLNTAFYEAQGLKGWEAMEKTVNYIGNDHFKIADAKRGDIGNTSLMYARAFLENMPFDAITVAPYMGEDSIRPFLQIKNKWAIVLGLTSNKGSVDFQQLEIKSSKGELSHLYEQVLTTVSSWGSSENLMFVIGATQPAEFENIRSIVPGHFFLVPGVGAQGGDLGEVSSKAMNSDCGIIVNSSRAIIYASSGKDYAEAAAKAARENHEAMKPWLDRI